MLVLVLKLLTPTTNLHQRGGLKGILMFKKVTVKALARVRSLEYIWLVKVKTEMYSMP